jgi:hypothetical protein
MNNTIENIKSLTGFKSDQKLADFFGADRATLARIKKGQGKTRLYYFISILLEALPKKKINLAVKQALENYPSH